MIQRVFETSASQEFLDAFNAQATANHPVTIETEEDIFSSKGLPYILPCLREKATAVRDSHQLRKIELIQDSTIKGLIHCHSNWSDGLHSLEEMALACIEKKWEYMVISDHSVSAFYAKGLNAERIAAQHQLIDQLNLQLAPFKIFKSIESDILNDGSLDYPEEILSSFDLVIASVHSNLRMNKEKATERLLNAIRNPYTTILGHLTGRLLLSREGYPLDHEKIIDSCATYGVAIEINAHPRRLDIDWRWIDSCLEKGVLLSINPDAHSIEGLNDVRYGVLVAQKGGLGAVNNLSSFTRSGLENWLSNRKSH
jgi:DNA polymerase (family 10)